MVIHQHWSRTVLAIVRVPLFALIAVLDFYASTGPGLRIFFVIVAAFITYAGVRSIWGGVVLLDDRMIVRSEVWSRVIPLSAIDDVLGDRTVAWHTESGAALRTRLTMFRDWWLGGGSGSAHNRAAMMRIAAWVEARPSTPSPSVSSAAD